jgi:type IV pilus assembly protein PilA
MNAPPLQPAPSKPFPTWVIVMLCVLGAVVVFGGVLAVLAIYGVRKYIANAKTAEARNAVGQIARDAASAYERDHRLCPSASSPVPSSVSMVRGMKYQSAPEEWQVDRARSAGFACLGFSMDMPQYFQYSYTVSKTNPDEFMAVAHGDLNGDGTVSTFRVRGVVKDGVLEIAPNIEETSPEE